jgi:methylmalonyl-CoA mutase N-terminal domain/subunit
MWATIVRERFGAKNPRSWLLRQPNGAHMGYYNATVKRPLNNLTRAVIGGVASALSGYAPVVEPPFDEALGLGWSREGMQLSEDAARILMYEARLTEVRDPLAGSYYVESLTNEIESDAYAVVADIDDRGGAVAAIESGYMPDAITRSAVQRSRDIETGRRVVVGVNAFVDDEQITVDVDRVHHPYDLERVAAAEGRQLEKLDALRKRRDSLAVVRSLDVLRRAAERTDESVMPALIDCLRHDATLGEICGALRDVFGEHHGISGQIGG